MRHLPHCEGKLLYSLITTVVLASVLLFVPYQTVRALSAIPMIFILPGYLLLELLWPTAKLDRLWRLALVVPVSIALVGGILLLLSYFWTYTYERAVALLVFLNSIMAVSGYFRCRAVAQPDGHRSNRLSQIEHFVESYRPTGWHALLAFSFLVLLGSIGYAIVTPRQPPRLTEFYILTEDGHLPISPDSITDSVSTLMYGIRNHEGGAIQYRVVVHAITAQGNTTELWSESVSVPDGATLERPFDISLRPPDTTQIELLLYLPGASQPYRSLYLWLNVTAE